MLSLQAKLEMKNLLKSTKHSLTVDDFDDIVKLDKLCKAITDSESPINDIIDMPVVVGGYQLKQPSIGVLEWYNEWYLPMFDGDALMSDVGLAYALSLSDVPTELWNISDKKIVRKNIKLFMRQLGCTHEELRVVQKKLLNISEEDESNGKEEVQEEDEPENTGKLIAVLCKEYGHTAPYWLWEAPIGLINTFADCNTARVEAEVESTRNACSTNKPPPAATRIKKFKELREHKNMMRNKWQKMQK